MTAPLSPRMQMLLHAPIPGMLWRLAAPNVAAVILMSSVTIADAWFVGQLGTAALASLALVFPFQTLMQMMAGGSVGGGTTSAVGRAMGGGNVAKATSIAWHAAAIAAIMAALYMLTFGLLARQIFSLLGGEGAALEGAVLYAKIAFGGALTTWFLYVISAILRGTGDTVTPARAMIACCFAQVPMSGALTLGWGPFPAIGIAGPAAAMVICHGTAAAYLALFVLGGKAAIRLQPQRPSWGPFADIMKVGGIGFFNSATIALTVVAVTGIVGRYGTEALAGYGLGSRLELMLIPIAFGVGAALTAAVGINVGAGQHARARRIAWTGGSATFLVTGLIGAVVAVAPHLWLDRFTVDPAAYAFGAMYLAIAGPFYGVFGAGQSLYFASQGTGRMVLPVSVSLVRFTVVAAVGAAAVFLVWPLEFVFAGVAAGLAVFGIGQALCLRGSGWRP